MSLFNKEPKREDVTEVYEKITEVPSEERTTKFYDAHAGQNNYICMTELEYYRYLKFRQDNKGKEITIHLTPTGIGLAVEVTADEIIYANITDYDSW
jgi:hypothetical protein